MPLQPGFPAPDITAQTETGKSVHLSDFEGRKNVLLFFYPQDDTSGCTKEACAFRDAKESLDAGETVIFGVSTDDADSHRAFIEKYGLNFPLLVDTDRKICEAFDVPCANGSAKRTTFLIDREGKINRTWENVVVADHADEVRLAIEQLNSGY